MNFVTARSDSTSSEFTAIWCDALGLNTNISPLDVITILRFQGRWGNSFSDLRKPPQPTGNVINDLKKRVVSKIQGLNDEMMERAEVAVVNGEGPAAAESARTNGEASLSLWQKLMILIWSEGPTGPRDKSLERVGMNRLETRELLEAL